MYRVVVLLLLSFVASTAHGQYKWKLKKEEDGIRIYTAADTNSAFKVLKVECTVAASLNQLIAFLLDIEHQPKWVYSTDSSSTIKKVQPNELIFYSQVALPWPCMDRDYVAHFRINQPGNGITTIDSRTDADVLPPRKGFVRVEKSVAHWDITPVGNTALKVVYQLSFNPGGSLPAWLVNMFITKGPIYTFKNLREGVKKPEYKNVAIPFLRYGI